MTPLGKIEEGIIGGDWKLVCDGFNRLTGKKVTPPLTKQIQEVFDPNTAKKAQLYSWLKTNTDMEMGPPKEYSIEDLREIVNVHILSEAPAKRDSGYTNPFKSNQDVKLEGGGAFLDIELGDGDLLAQFGGDLLQGRGDLLAGAAPLGPEIDQHGLAGLQDVLFEGLVGDRYGAHQKLLFTLGSTKEPRCSIRHIGGVCPGINLRDQARQGFDR